MLLPTDLLEASDLAVAEFKGLCAGRPGQEVIVVLLRANPGHTEGDRYQIQDHLVTEVLKASAVAIRRVDIADSDELEVPVRLAMVCDADSGSLLWPVPARPAAGPRLSEDGFWDAIGQCNPSIQFSKVTNFWT